jgi:uncharacterized membrane protein
MRLDRSITVQAPAERVWEVFSDVAKWPEWTPTVDAVGRLDEGRIHIGARTRVRQPKLPVAIWEVTELVAGLTKRYIALETESLKKVSEQA